MVNYTPEMRRVKKGSTKTPVLVKEIMQKNFVQLKETMLTAEAAQILLKHGLTGAPVLNEKSELIGFLSEKDCLNRVMTSRYLNTPSFLISEYMTTELITVAPENNLFDIVELFTKHPYQCYPVLENKKAVGLVYRRHCLKAAIETYEKGFA